MKQKDIVLIVVVVFVSSIISFFVSKTLFSSPSKRQEQVEDVQAITSTFPSPDKRFFNRSAIDPAPRITVDQNTTTDPFSGGGQ